MAASNCIVPSGNRVSTPISARPMLRDQNEIFSALVSHTICPRNPRRQNSTSAMPSIP